MICGGFLCRLIFPRSSLFCCTRCIVVLGELEYLEDGKYDDTPSFIRNNVD